MDMNKKMSIIELDCNATTLIYFLTDSSKTKRESTETIDFIVNLVYN